MNMTHCKSLFSFIRQRAENDAALWQMVQQWNECLNGTLNSAKMKAMLILIHGKTIMKLFWRAATLLKQTWKQKVGSFCDSKLGKAKLLRQSLQLSALQNMIPLPKLCSLTLFYYTLIKCNKVHFICSLLEWEQTQLWPHKAPYT